MFGKVDFHASDLIGWHLNERNAANVSDRSGENHELEERPYQSLFSKGIDGRMPTLADVVEVLDAHPERSIAPRQFAPR